MQPLWGVSTPHLAEMSKTSSDPPVDLPPSDPRSPFNIDDTPTKMATANKAKNAAKQRLSSPFHNPSLIHPPQITLQQELSSHILFLPPRLLDIRFILAIMAKTKKVAANQATAKEDKGAANKRKNTTNRIKDSTNHKKAQQT